MEDSENDPSLLMLIQVRQRSLRLLLLPIFDRKTLQNWLERTPGLKQATIDGEVEEGFWPRYERAVRRYLSDLYEEAMVTTSLQLIYLLVYKENFEEGGTSTKRTRPTARRVPQDEGLFRDNP